MIEAIKIPVPDADSQLKLNTAASVVNWATTGGTRSTNLSRPGTGNLNSEKPSKNAFVCGKPQTKTTTLRIIQGSHARRIADCGLRIADFVCTSAVMPSRLSDSDLSPGKRQICFGCQTLRNKATAAIELTAATTSTSHGP